MASVYPGSFDAISDPGATLAGPPTHSALHDDMADAIEAIQAELGLTPSGAAATVAARFATLDTLTATIPRRGGHWSRGANQSVPPTTVTVINWDSETADTDGFLTPTSGGATVPTGLGGLYAVTTTLAGSATLSASFLRISVGSLNFDFSGNVSASNLSGSVVLPIVAAQGIQVSVYHANGAAVNFTGWMFVYRVGP